jgi:hypothetical protein
MIPDSNEIRIEVSTECNFKCVICPHDEMERTKEKMPLSRFHALIEKVDAETDQYDTVTFSGIGEPLTNIHLPDMVWVAKNLGYRTLLLTNASMLTPKKFNTLRESGLDSVRVSFYGDSYRTYAKAHGVPLQYFGKTMGNVMHMSTNRQDVELILTFNVIPDVNEGDVDDWIDFWKDKADLLEVWRPHNWVYGEQFRKVQKVKNNSCGRPFNGPLQIQVDGTVIMCCFDYEGELLLGDLNTQTLEEIFTGVAYCDILADHSTGLHIGTTCQLCDQRNADKSDVMVYSSRDEKEERVTRTSTTYRRVQG